MKNNIKFLLLSCLILSTDIFAAVTGPASRESYTLHYGITVRQLDLCTDWACTTPFNVFTGSQYLAVNTAGVVPGYGEISINIPNSGTYSQVRLKMDNAWVLNGYSSVADEGAYCASGSSSTDYSTEAAAKAAATDVTFPFVLSRFLRKGNGVDAAGYGRILYGTQADQTSIPGGYFAKGAEGAGGSNYDAYTKLVTRDSGNDDLYITTVLQGDHDFGLGLPSTIIFGITVLEHRGIEGGVCDTGWVDVGLCVTAQIGTCVLGAGEPLFDFVIQ